MEIHQRTLSKAQQLCIDEGRQALERRWTSAPYNTGQPKRFHVRFVETEHHWRTGDVDVFECTPIDEQHVSTRWTMDAERDGYRVFVAHGAIHVEYPHALYFRRDAYRCLCVDCSCMVVSFLQAGVACVFAMMAYICLHGTMK